MNTFQLERGTKLREVAVRMDELESMTYLKMGQRETWAVEQLSKALTEEEAAEILAFARNRFMDRRSEANKEFEAL